jgi:hypothetical protein
MSKGALLQGIRKRQKQMHRDGVTGCRVVELLGIAVSSGAANIMNSLYSILHFCHSTLWN